MFPELGVDDFDDLPEMTPLQNLEQKPGAKAAPRTGTETRAWNV